METKIKEIFGTEWKNGKKEDFTKYSVQHFNIFTRSFYITNGTGEQYIITSSCTHCVESSACFIQKYPTGYVTLGLFTYSHNTNMHVLNVVWYKSTLLFIYLLCAGLLGWQSEIEGLILHSTQVNTEECCLKSFSDMNTDSTIISSITAI